MRGILASIAAALVVVALSYAIILVVFWIMGAPR